MNGSLDPTAATAERRDPVRETDEMQRTGRASSNQMVGLVTIGRSPRPDLLNALGLTERQDVSLFGALDDLDISQLQDMVWHPGDASLPLFVWYDQRPLIVSKHRLSEHVTATVEKALDRGCSVVTVLCTESFSEVRVPNNFVNIRVDKLLFHSAERMVANSSPMRIGTLVPVEGQVVPGETRWGLVGEVRAMCLPPRSSEVAIRDRCRQLVAVCGWTPDVVVLDCMGYGAREQAIVADEIGSRIISPVELLKSELHRHMQVPRTPSRG